MRYLYTKLETRFGTGTAHLFHEIFRVKNIPFKVDVLDDETAASLRKFYLTYYDIRAVIMDLVSKLDEMRHLDHLPRYRQQILSLKVLKIYSPLAHAVGANQLLLELEDISFRYLFPGSYLYLDSWLRSHEDGYKPLIDVYKEQLHQSLKADLVLAEMVDDVYVKGRYKSRYSMMKKLVRDGRKPEEVNDVLGLRVILMPNTVANNVEVGERACYRTSEIIRSLWKEIPHRTKDSIDRPKENGYRNLHMAVDVSDSDQRRPLMEIQTRTMDMDLSANAGTASHSLYKGGLTDPKSIEEQMELMEELGAPCEDAEEMIQLLDSNSDGSLSSDEFDTFQKQVKFMRKWEDRDNK